MKRRIPARADVGAVMLFWAILVCVQSAAALLWRGGGGTGAPAPVFLNTACAQEIRQGFILKHPSVCVFIVLGN